MFGLKITISNVDEQSNNYLKEATKLKNKNINKAIDLLKKAYKEISKNSIDYSVEVFLRLPMYLQEANRQDEAWQEFENLLKNGYINQNRNPELIPMTDSIIYDKMRLFLQREKKYKEAISYGLYSILLSELGLHRQKRYEELYTQDDKNIIIERIIPLLKKAKNLDLIENIYETFMCEINKLPNIIIFDEFKRKINILIEHGG